MKLTSIKVLKYAFYAGAGIAQLGTAYLVFSKGDDIKSGIQLLELSSTNTRLALLWCVAALVAFYAPVFARHFQGLQDRLRLNDKEFVELYKDSLQSAINDLIDVREDPTKSDRVELGILQTIVSLVQYYVGTNDETRVNANLMVPLDPNHPDCSNILFLETPRSEALKQCRWLLRIDKWALFEAEIPPDFCLPVYDPDGPFRNRILLGAPLAFIQRKTFLLNNTKRLRKHWATGVSTGVKLEMGRYFRNERKVLRSFASIPVLKDSNSPPLAILNIQWRRTKILGSSAGLVQDLLLPFLLVLAHVRSVGESPEEE